LVGIGGKGKGGGGGGGKGQNDGIEMEGEKGPDRRETVFLSKKKGRGEGATP